MIQTFLTVTALARNLLRALSVLLLAFYLSVILLQVFFRYVLNESLFWSEEVVRYSLVWGVMLGAALVAYDRGHINIDIVSPFLPDAGKRVLQFIANSCTLAFLVILAYAGWDFTDRTWFQNSASLEVPMRAVYLAMPIGAFLEAWFMTAAWLQERDAPLASEADKLL
ncbi:MAG: TRAP transporter small permease [Alphaproteobacteria bacterium]|nr:TRAP transporter small permease [Alphaproteobacteria bacterium]